MTGNSVIRCQVCTADLAKAKLYYLRNLICEQCSKAPTCEYQGTIKRWCQQCCKFQELDEFETDRRTCRWRLALHNARRKRRTGVVVGDPDSTAPSRYTNHGQDPPATTASGRPQRTSVAHRRVYTDQPELPSEDEDDLVIARHTGGIGYKRPKKLPNPQMHRPYPPNLGPHPGGMPPPMGNYYMNSQSMFMGNQAAMPADLNEYMGNMQYAPYGGGGSLPPQQQHQGPPRHPTQMPHNHMNMHPTGHTGDVELLALAQELGLLPEDQGDGGGQKPMYPPHLAPTSFPYHNSSQNVAQQRNAQQQPELSSQAELLSSILRSVGGGNDGGGSGAPQIPAEMLLELLGAQAGFNSHNAAQQHQSNAVRQGMHHDAALWQSMLHGALPAAPPQMQQPPYHQQQQHQPGGGQREPSPQATVAMADGKGNPAAAGANNSNNNKQAAAQPNGSGAAPQQQQYQPMAGPFGGSMAPFLDASNNAAASNGNARRGFSGQLSAFDFDAALRAMAGLPPPPAAGGVQQGNSNAAGMPPPSADGA